MWRRFDIRLLVIILLLTSGLALTLTLYNSNQTSAALRELATSSYQQLAQVEASKIRDVLLNRRLDVLFVSQASALRRFANAADPLRNTDAVTQYLLSYLRLNQDRFVGACLLDANGFELSCVDNDNGRLTVIPTESLGSRADAPYFLNAMTTISIPGESAPVYISSPMLDAHQSDKPRSVLVMSTRVQSDNGLTVGVLTMEMALDSIQELLFRDLNVRSFLIDSQGQYVLSAKHTTPADDGISFTQQHPTATEYILKRSEGVYIDEEHQLLQVFARVRPSGQSSVQWTLITEVPLAIVTAPAERARLTSFGLSVALLAALGGLSWFIARRVTVPLRQLTTLAEHIQSGATDAPPLVERSTQEVHLLEIALRQLDTRVQNLLNTEKERVHELEAARAFLQESEVRFRTMADSAPALIWLSDKSQAHIYFNQTWRNFTAHSLADELAQGWSHDIHPDDRTRAEYTYVTAFERRESFEMEYRRMRHDGMYRWLKDQGVPRFSPDGTFDGYVGISVDITDIKDAQRFLTDMSRELEARVQERTEALNTLNHKLKDEIQLRERAEIEIREQAALLQMLTDFASDLICLHQPDGTFEFVSPSSTTLLGYTPEYLEGKNPYDFFHPDDIATHIVESHRAAVVDKQSTNTTYRFRTANGSYIWLETATEPVISNEGQVHHIVTVSRDVTQQRLQQQRLKESERFLHSILNGQTSQIVVLDDEGTMIEANQAWRDEAESSHHSPIVVWGEGINYLLACAIVGQTGNEIARAILEGVRQVMDEEAPIFTYEYHLQNDTHDRWYMLQVNSFPFGDEKRLLLTHTDITGQKVVEMSVRASLQQEQRLNQLHAEFVSMVSHDFRNPLAAIITTTDILMRYSERFTEAERVQRLMRIQSNVNHLNRLVDDISYINDAESKEIPLNLETVDLLDLTRPIIQDVELAYESPHLIELQFELETSEVKLDPHLYHKIMNNLLGNALKYGRGKPIVLSVCDDEQNLKITIQDNGIGIPAKDQSTLFSIFQRASNVGTIKGTGLGLVIVKQAVEAHGGTITLESREGEGTRFTVTLPKLT